MTRRTPADALLSSLPEHNIGMAMTDAISARLDALVELANTAGARTTRKELIASLVLVAVPSSGELAENVHRYRTAQARDTLLEEDRNVAFLTFATQRPGPRGRKPRTPASGADGRNKSR